MSSFEEHAALVADLLAPALVTAVETVALDAALGRVTFERIVSPVDLPLFRNSQMDGFAVRAADVAAAPTTLRIAGIVAAGAAPPPSLAVGSAMRIMTGAIVPQGANAVIPVEDCVVDGEFVIVSRGRALGEYVRDRASDVHEGDELLPAGVRLESRHLAVLAAAGLDSVEVRARVSVAIITTGAELVPPGGTPRGGQVFDSNATALAAAVRSVGAIVASSEYVGDDAAAFLAVLSRIDADLVLTSGGISMGDFEVVREALEPLGARIAHVAMQPGGPQATAVFEGMPVICFPGNPVSTQISFEVFVAPLLRNAAGLPAARIEPRGLTAAVTNAAGKRQFLRGKALDGGLVELVSGPGSHLVAGLAASDVLIIVPEEVTTLAAGDSVQAWAL